MSVPGRESVLGLNRRVARVLFVGAVASTALVVVGLVLLLANPSEQVALTLPLDKLPSAIEARQPAAYVTLGILVMIVTPIARVVVLVEGFLARGDRVFVLVGVVVLTILLLSMLLGFR
jgi:uncharacterized membrane protein